ncbi:MAG: PQQ-dependent sugar dehydrogenase [Acidimicrobiales bacterium]
MTRLVQRLGAVMTLALMAAACASGDDAAPSASTTSAPPGAAVSSTPQGTGPERPSERGDGPDLAAVRLGLAEIDNLTGPVALAVRPGDDNLYVAEKRGQVRRVVQGQSGGDAVDAQPVLDLSGEVSTGSEQGLLGLTFSPDGERLYVDYTDRAGDTRVVEYAFRDGRADVATRRVLLAVDQPFANHNGGEVAFGPDGMLYVGLGDGGGQRDPSRNGQNLGTLLGKILRIDPTPSGDRPYTVPPDNPFVNRPGAAPEIFALGLRNPWRFTWDRSTADLWIADVGQDRWEEIDFRPAGSPPGANFGWSLMDSTHPLHGTNPPDGILPIVEYTHDDDNCSVTGGYVYRGSRIPALQGVYLYCDYCSGSVWGLVQDDAKVAGQRQLDLPSHRIYSFGEDASGELYLLAADGLYRIQGA